MVDNVCCLLWKNGVYALAALIVLFGEKVVV